MISRLLRVRSLSTVLFAAAITGAALIIIPFAPPAAAAFGVVGSLFAVLGAVIAVRQPGNRIAAFMLTVGGLIALNQLAYVPIRSEPSAMTPLVFVSLFLVGTLWVPIFVTIFHLLYVFPTGGLVSIRWRWVYYVEVLTWVSFASLTFLSGRIGPPDDTWTMSNPLAIWGDRPELQAVALNFMSFGWATLVVGGLIALVVRWRRSSWAERNQMKLVLLGLVAALLGWLLQSFYSDATGAGGVLVGVIFVGFVAAIPILMTVAIVRHGLFDIDRIVSRTVSYGLVVGLLALVFLGVTLLASLFPTDSDLVIAAATLAVAALFNPVRNRIQARVDRRFNRSRYNTVRVIDNFSGSLRDQVDPDQVIAGWAGVVAETMQPSELGVWIKARAWNSQDSADIQTGR